MTRSKRADMYVVEYLPHRYLHRQLCSPQTFRNALAVMRLYVDLKPVLYRLVPVPRAKKRSQPCR